MTSSQTNKRSGQISFIIAVVVLGLAAVGLNGATQFLKLYFKKLPVALQLPLKEIPQQLGPWKQVFSDKPLEADLEHSLGTNEYIMRLYADTRIIQPALIEDVESEDATKRAEALSRFAGLQHQHPEAFLNMGVTYYTGMVDTVAHIPDRCYIADGFEPTNYEVVTWPTQPNALTVRYINFEDQTARGLENRNVAYFFHVNGAYEEDPITGVRLRLQDLRERHGYYAKIELMNQVKDQSQASKPMIDFLNAAIPSIEKCLPDWSKVKADEKASKGH